MQILSTPFKRVRSIAVLIAAGVLVSCSSDSGSGPAGPSGSNLQQIAGQWRGTVEIVEDTCDNELGIDDSGIVTIVQNGASITITDDEGTSFTGTIEAGGSISATGSMVEDGLNISMTLDGQVTGDSFEATYTMVVGGGVCMMRGTVLLDRM